MITRLFLICALSLSVVPASADDSAQANRLLVEAVHLIGEAGTKQTSAEQLRLLEASHAKLIEIVEQHPSTDLAVKLATGQSIGVISLGGITAEIEKLRQQSTADKVAADRDTCLKSLDATDPRCAIWFGEIVRAHLRAGNTQAALETAMTAAPGTVRDGALYDIARHYAQAGNAKQALAIVDSIETEAARINAQHNVNADILQSHMRSGHFQEALAAAQVIEHPGTRHQTLRQIAVAQAQAGKVQDAYATVRLINDLAIGSIAAAEVDRISQRSMREREVRQPAEKDNDRARIQDANRQLQAGNIDEAVNTAEQIENAEFSAQILDQVAMIQLQAGNMEGALNTAGKIRIATNRDTVFARIAQRQLQIGQFEGASSTAKLIQTPGIRDQVYQELARLYTHTQAKDLDKALAFANLIDKDDARDIRLNSIAQAKLQTGDLLAALAIAKSMTPSMRDNVFQEVVKVQTQAGQLVDALVVAKLIRNANTRHTRLYYIAQAQLQGGDPEGASATAELIPDGSFRNEILKAVRQRTQ